MTSVAVEISEFEDQGQPEVENQNQRTPGGDSRSIEGEA
jgi:hypothetical protein